MSRSSRTNIVATIGPASTSQDVLAQMIDAGMDMARLNFSHGTHEEHAKLIESVRAEAEKQSVLIPIIQDLSGPRTSTKGGHTMDITKETVITEKDLDDALFGIKQKVEWIALSYVKDASDIEHLRSFLHEHKGSSIRIIAKIERKDAIKNIQEIIRVSDGIMIARGDLGEQMPLEKLPFLQKYIIRQCNWEHRFAITATEMMRSMVENPRPTRAETTDVANAILDGSDAVMLSEETAMGKYPAQTIRIMEKIIKEAERYITVPPRFS